MNERELRRQILHILYGITIVLLHKTEILKLPLMFIIIVAGGLMSYLVYKKRASPVRRLLMLFEREHHLANFPGRGILFFSIGAFLVLWIFQDEVDIAYAGILILSIGDALTNIIGRHWGRLKTKLNPDKYIEGTAIGILASIPIAYYFVPNLLAAFAAACVAMMLEMPNIKIFGFEIDDNLIIPLGASITLSLFNT